MLFNLSVVLFTACSTKNIDIERINIDPVIVYDSIESRMPGQLMLNYPYIIWTDPLNPENQAHIIDLKTNKEIGKFINIGNGPEEFITPSFSISTKNKLFVHDINRDKISIFFLDSILNKGNLLISTTTKKTKGKIRIIEIENNSFVYFDPTAQFPFETDNKKQFGKYPFDANIENKYNITQGNIAYNPENGYFIYSTIFLPYIAAYQKKEDNFELIWEKREEVDYYISENKIVLNGKKKGAMELALTKDYIVTLQRDYQNDPTDERNVGRDFTKIPQTLFLYDYTSNLKKIIHLHMPILRIAADVKSNTVYAIVVNPDFMLVKCELPNVT